jgi:hexokinase
LGAIFGTGTNGAYVEQVVNITKLGNSPAASHGGQMVVNAEWGAFNSSVSHLRSLALLSNWRKQCLYNKRSHLPITPYDNTLDRLSINPRAQAFEKFISGMYLGEITRHVLVSLVDAAPHGLLFAGNATEILNTQWGLDTSVMSDIENAWLGSTTSEKEEELPKISDFDEGKLKASTRERLERVKGVIVKSLGYAEKDVSLKDAAVRRYTLHLPLIRNTQFLS